MNTPQDPLDSEDPGADRRTAALAGLAAVIGLMVLGLLLVQQLHHSSAIEDCLLAGHHDCTRLALPNPGR